nr:hypothetical protein [Tanacetum cinerariifolium]
MSSSDGARGILGKSTLTPACCPAAILALMTLGSTPKEGKFSLINASFKAISLVYGMVMSSVQRGNIRRLEPTICARVPCLTTAPNKAVESAIRPREQTVASKALYKNVFPVPPGPTIKNTPGESASTCLMMQRPSTNLAPGNYVQWKSRINRYIDTKPNHELIHYCLKNPPYELGWIDKEIPISKGSPITRTERFQETYKNVSQDIRDQLNAKAEAVQIILTGIDNDIYSTVDDCPNACEMWKAIERNQCKVINHQVNVQFLLQLQPEWQRFVTLVKQNQELKTISYYKLYDILKQHQHEVNEIRAERIARVPNPLALVAQQQPVYHPQTHPTHYTQNSTTRSQQAATRNRGKAIVYSPQPIYDQEPSMVAEEDKTSKDKEIDKLMALISLSKSTNQFLNEIDRLSREYYYADHMNAILGVYTELDEVTNLQCDYLELLEKCKRLETELSKSKMMSKSFESTLPPNKKSIVKNTNVLALGMYKLHTDHNQARTSQLPQDSRKTNKRVTFSIGVIPTTSVSRPQLKSNPIGDRVMRNNSQGKKQDVEDQRRNVKLSKNKTSVTACNDSLNAKTLNVNSVCATYDECVLNDKHNMCVLKSVEKPLKKTVASESKQKPRNITRKLYER